MKTFFTLIAVCGVVVSAFAQIEKGRSYVTGQLSLVNTDQVYHQYYNNNNFTNDNTSKSNGFGGSVSYGYLFAKDWAVGVRGDYSTSKTHNDAIFNGNPTLTYSNGDGYGLFLYLRKYFPISEKLYIHLDGGVSYANNNSKSNDVTNDVWSKDTSETKSVYINPGITYFATRRLAVTANIGSISYNKRDQTTNTNTFTSTTHVKDWTFSPRLNSIALGVSVYFK